VITINNNTKEQNCKNDILINSKSAMIIIDMQNDFCKPKGVFYSMKKDLSMVAKIIPKSINLINSLRKKGVFTIFVKQTTLKYGYSTSISQKRFREKVAGNHKYTIKDSWGHQIISDFKIMERDIVIEKYRASAFIGTPLDLILRSNNINTLIVGGIWTNGCIESTARDAQQHDYSCIIAEDCVASNSKELHESSMKVMKTRYEVLNSKQIINKL